MKSSNTAICEALETSLSALIDGELETPEQLSTLDHLLECPSCQEFYRQARTLDSMTASMGTHSTEPAPLEVWDRIAVESGLAEQSSDKAPLIASWARQLRDVPGALQLAAVLVLAVGLWLLRPVVSNTSVPGPDRDRETDVVNVTLEENRGSMSDERFLELATEILRADRDYHRRMLEIMRVVGDMAARPEGSGDQPAVTVRDDLGRNATGDRGENISRWSGDQL